MAAMGKLQGQPSPHFETPLDVAENEARYQASVGSDQGCADSRSCPAD